MPGRNVSKNESEQPALPNLAVPKVEAEKLLNLRIESGKKLVDSTITSEETLNNCRHEYYSWDEFNRDLLRRIFTTSEIAENYMGGYVGGFGYSSLQSEIEGFHYDVKDKIRRLESIRERLSLYGEPSVVPESMRTITFERPSKQVTKTVFIVHGKDDGLKETVARFLTKLKLEPIILHEQPNAGLTVPEKLERYASTAFAIILLTPDDKGGLTTEDKLKPRARQNVVFELGYFIGKLGRERVCALYSEGVDLPSDFQGVLYIPLKSDSWRFHLAKELKQAGLDVDMNDAL